MTEIDPNKKPLQNDHFNMDIVENEIILYFPDGNQFLYLNQTAAIVWEQCNGSVSIDELVTGLEEAFPDAKSQIRDDVMTTINTFLQNSCIRLV